MAAQGRGSGAVVLAAAAALVLCVLLHEAQVAESAVFTVGDGGGWSFSSNSWTNGKRFKAGDVLVFKYDSSSHNVVAVNAAGYKGCSAPRGAKVYSSGNDRVTLARGTNYFICSIPGHCQSGMKIAVNAA
ncbi:chemocyanin precursor [Panicum miliaceum]|uniref:Plantacyanin n=1 Tax=Panicum miliaceum TaxID=4540 RepID=A0A3L6TQ22_PANMI|nr:chemocyanin precursor [Panicum miliaceum]